MREKKGTHHTHTKWDHMGDVKHFNSAIYTVYNHLLKTAIQYIQHLSKKKKRKKTTT